MASNLSFLDRYISGESVIHRASAQGKLVVTLGFIFAMISLPPGAWPAYVVMFLLAWSAVALSGVGIGRIFRRSLVAGPFVVVAVPVIFNRPGPPLFEVGLGFMHLTATQAGLDFFLAVLLKSWASVTAANLFTATTPFSGVVDALRYLRLPAVLIAIISFMYRYIFVLVDEVQRLLRARSARSAAVGPNSGGSLLWRAKVAGGMAGSMFIRTYDRSERIYMAMLARGYDGSVRRSTASAHRTWLLPAGVPLCIFAIVAVVAQVMW